MALSVIASSGHRDLPTESSPLLSEESGAQITYTSKLDYGELYMHIIVKIISLVFLRACKSQICMIDNLI